jgi:hypothetical protein
MSATCAAPHIRSKHPVPARPHRRLPRSQPLNFGNRLIYLALGGTADSGRDLLGLRAGEHGDGEGAEYWLRVLAEIKNRGVRDVCMVVCDWLKGLPDAVSAVSEQTIVQTWIVPRRQLAMTPEQAGGLRVDDLVWDDSAVLCAPFPAAAALSIGRTAFGLVLAVAGRVAVAAEDLGLSGFGCWRGGGGSRAGRGFGRGRWCAAGPAQVFQRQGDERGGGGQRHGCGQHRRDGPRREVRSRGGERRGWGYRGEGGLRGGRGR